MDLGQAWHEWTGLPFVYAVWAGPAAADPQVLEGLEACWRHNQDNLTEIIPQAVPDAGRRGRVLRYIEEHIHYRLGPAEECGLNLFLKKARRKGWLPDSPEVVCHG